MKEKTGRPILPDIVTKEQGTEQRRWFAGTPGLVKGIMLAGEFWLTTKTGNYNAGDEMVILVDASTGDKTITLPAASTNPFKVYWIKKIDSSGNSVTIKGNVIGEAIDGEENIILNLQYSYIMVICDGSNWYIIGGEYVKMEDILLKSLSVQEKNKKLLGEIKKQLVKINS